MLEFQIRPYQNGDDAQLINLWQLVFPNDPPWNEPSKLIDRKLKTQPDLIFVAVNPERIIGAVMAGFDGVRGWIHHLAVDEGVRRQGVAAALMRAAETGLRSYECDKVNLQVRDTNSSVISFYRTIGYEVEPRVSLGKRLE